MSTEDDEPEQVYTHTLEIKMVGPIVQTVETDVPTLQRMCRENWDLYNEALDRLKKARKQRNDVRERLKATEQRLAALLPYLQHARECSFGTHVPGRGDLCEVCTCGLAGLL